MALLMYALLGCFMAYNAYAGNVACPATSSFIGCFSRRCIQVSKNSGQQATVCDECGAGSILVYKGTAEARCDCAPGAGVWVNGQYTDYICRPCPAGTQIALGGNKLSAKCMNCPATTSLGTVDNRHLNAWGTQDCVCPAGYYRAPKARAGTDLMPVECRACTALKAYTSVEGNVLSRCSICGEGKVANQRHTMCVDPSDPDAAKPGSDDGIISTEGLDPMNVYSTSRP